MAMEISNVVEMDISGKPIRRVRDYREQVDSAEFVADLEPFVGKTIKVEYNFGGGGIAFVRGVLVRGDDSFYLDGGVFDIPGPFTKGGKDLSTALQAFSNGMGLFPLGKLERISLYWIGD